MANDDSVEYTTLNVETLGAPAERQLPELFAGAADLPFAVRQALSNAKAVATKRAYISDWRIWFDWCRDAGKSPVPADPVDVAEFLSLEAIDRKMSTVIRRSAAIATLHRLAGFESPCSEPLVKETLAGLRRMHADVPKAKSKALVGDALKEIIANPNPLANPNEKKVLRDHALLLVGYAAAMRRSELVLLEYEHISRVTQGIEIFIPHSKTDQIGEGIVKRIPHGMRTDTCPIRALEAWCEAADIESGWVFRPITRHGKIQERPLSDRSVARIVKAYAVATGIEGSTDMAGHSLRSGAATTAAQNGASMAQLLQLGAWKDSRTALRYIQERDAWDNVPGDKLGL